MIDDRRGFSLKGVREFLPRRERKMFEVSFAEPEGGPEQESTSLSSTPYQAQNINHGPGGASVLTWMGLILLI